jgi:hypothetical protein
MRGASGHPTTGPEMAYCIMKAVANKDTKDWMNTDQQE